MEMYNPPHPGKILLEEWIKPLNFTITSFALRLGMSRKNLSEIVNEKTGITAETALKIEKALNSRAGFWLDMQQSYDLWQAKQRVNLDDIEPIEKAI